MCYRCQACNNVAQPGTPRATYVIQERTRPGTKYKEIAKEIGVCPQCFELLKIGTPISYLASGAQPKKVPSGDAPKPVSLQTIVQSVKALDNGKNKKPLILDTEDKNSGKRPRKKKSSEVDQTLDMPLSVPQPLIEKNAGGTRRGNGKSQKGGAK